MKSPTAGGRRPRPTLRQSLVWYGFVLPPFALLILFVLYPTYESFRLSVYGRKRDGTSEFVGFEHYSRLVDDGVFWQALLNTVLLGTVFLALVIPLAVILASLLNGVRRGATPLKVVYFLPQLTSSVAVAIIFSYVFQPDWGLLNGALTAIGVDTTPLWLSDPTYGLTTSRAAATVLAVYMGLGYFALISLSGMQSIQRELYEAASLDGAGAVRTWWHITLPGLRPILIFLFMTGMIDSMARFADLWTLGGPGGAPARSLQSVVMYIFRTAYENSDMNGASAAAVIFFVILMVMTLVAYRVFLRNEFKAR